MSQLNASINAVQASHIYYDVVVSNLASTTTKPKPFYYSDQRTTPYLMNPELYTMSIVRFTLDTGSLPVFIPLIQPNQGDPDLTIYSVTLEYSGTKKQVFVQWQAQDKSVAVPPAPNQTTTGNQDNSTEYYNCYSYTWFCGLVTVALENAYALLLADYEEELPSQYAPFLAWDGTSQQGVFYADVDGYDLALTDPIKVFFNAPLYALFSSFPASYEGYNVLYGKNYQLQLRNVGDTNLTPIVVPGSDPLVQWNAITWYQEYSTVSAWTPIVSIVFTSNTLPIEANQVSTPLVYQNGNTVGLGGNNSDIANIITDLVSDNGQYRPNVVYNPSAEFRRISLKGNRPLYHLDLNIYYKNRLGQLIPFTLFSGCSATVKILFEKK